MPSNRPLTTLDDLSREGLAANPALAPVIDRYALAISPAMAALISRDDPDDPIARQFVPDVQELVTTPEEHADPIGDHVHSPLPGLVHRYPDRVLLKIVHVCPVYCRFCFRREMVGPAGDGGLAGEALEAAIAYVASRPAIMEVILTGGDPFMLSPRRVEDITGRLARIPHVRVIRWHTRVPVVDPARVTPALAMALRHEGVITVVGIHANHVRELTPEALGALGRLKAAGAMLVSQTVLLRGVNDTVETLADLMRGFIAAGVKPYYLHHPDHAPGTGHFRLSLDEGRALMRGLRGRVSGLALPTYVLDVPGGAGKVPVDLGFAGPDGIIDPWGKRHDYPPKMTGG